MGWLTTTDSAIGTTRPVWAWIGELALVGLGTHRAADHLDDLLVELLTATTFPWPSPEAPLTLAAGTALGLELLVLAYAIAARAMTVGQQPAPLRGWWRGASVRSVVTPVFWAAATLAGTWSVAIAAEDVVGMDVVWLGPVVAALVAWRVGWPGWVRMVRQLPAGPRLRGAWIAPVLLLVAGLALRHGLPVWGWL